MDLIFKRYSSPFLLLNTLIENNQFIEFIDDLIDITNEEKVYELWLYKINDKEYHQFRKLFTFLPNRNVKEETVDVNDILNKSLSVLNEIQL